MGTRSLPRRRLVFALLFIGLIGSLLPPSVLAANDRGLIFNARKGTANIVLLGSIHLGNDTVYPLRPAIETAFSEADALIVELDINAVDAGRIAAWTAEYGLYPPGDALSNHIGAETWQRLSVYLQNLQLPPATMARYRPGVLLNMLTMMRLTMDGLTPALGLDQHFLEAASAAGKPLIELETAEAQLSLLASMPVSDAVINDALDEMDNLSAASAELFDAWKSGDGVALAREIDREFDRGGAASRSFYARLFTERNRAMAERIAAESKTRPKLFVVIGAGHLLGADGVVALLRQQGFDVTQR